VSNRPLTRALAALASVSLAALAACASGGSANRDLPSRPAASDTASLGAGDGRTVSNMLQGRFPGVVVNPADGGGIQILIRGGSSSWNSVNDEPLYLLDDSPLPPGHKGIVYVNPNDIQRIQVLKNPEDVAVYGARGANGVVLITTRKGPKR
jgi:TonB-dependent starch-binding outer membrane protein SusC